jgi:hypothetical protein
MLLAILSTYGSVRWMNLLWMSLFAAIIFGETVWIKGGRWIAEVQELIL